MYNDDIFFDEEKKETEGSEPKMTEEKEVESEMTETGEVVEEAETAAEETVEAAETAAEETAETAEAEETLEEPAAEPEEEREHIYHYAAQDIYQDQQRQSRERYVDRGTFTPGYTGPKGPVKEDDKKAKKSSGWGSLIAKTVVVALVFGLVSGAMFQATAVVGNMLGGSKKTEEVAEAEKEIDIIDVPEESEESLPLMPDFSPILPTSQMTVRDIAKTCMPSLVAITNVSVYEVPNYFSYFFGGGGSRTEEQTSSGTGIIIGENESEYLIVSNNHVVEGATSLSVVFSVDENSEEPSAVPATIKGTDAHKDLAVIAVKIDDVPEDIRKELKVAVIGDSSELEVGDQVVAIGNALGYGQSVTTGIVSALGRTLESGEDANKLIQTDAAINPGNSGGALLNMKGEVIGINEAKVASSSVEGMGYAIPISDVENIISDLSLRITRDEVDEEKRGYLGITCQDVTADISEQFDMPEGIYISSVYEGSGADKAGLQKGDIITKFDGLSITRFAELKEQLAYYAAGEEVEVVVQRPDGTEYEEMSVTVTLSDAKSLED